MARLRLSVATKIALCFAVVLVTFASVAITSMFSLRHLGEDLGVVSKSYLPVTTVLAQIDSLLKNKERDTDRMLHERDSATKRILVRNTRNYFGKIVQDRFAVARAVLRNAQGAASPQDRLFFADLDRRLTQLSDRDGDYSAAWVTLSDTLSQPDPDEADVSLRSRELQRIENQVGESVSKLSASVESQIASRVNQVHTAEVNATWVIIGLSLGAIALGLLATGLSQRMLLPIRVLTEEVKGISRGEFGRRVELRSSDEVGTLAQEFNAMAASLREREHQLLEQRERLVRSERLAAIGKVAAQITHEIRNPLSSIGLNAELLADELEGAEFPKAQQRAEAKALLSAMSREIDRLTDISEQYLAFARPPRPAPSPVDVAELCRELLGLLGPELSGAGIEVALELDPQLPKVLGHEDQLRQALLNLIRNAKEAMVPRRKTSLGHKSSGDEGLALTVHAAEGTDGFVRIDVCDTGPGIPADVRDRIFEPFFSTKSIGTGLGLAISQRIAQEHGGSLALAEEGGGARFVLALPAAPRELPGGPSRENRDPPAQPQESAT